MLRRSIAAAAALAATLAVAPAAHAAKGGTCESFAVTVNGTTFRGDQKRTIAGPINSIQVRGTYITFDVTPSDFTTIDYAHTGKASPRPDKNLPITGRTVIFTKKQPLISEALTSSLSLEIKAESLVLERHGARQDMKIQAKDWPPGRPLPARAGAGRDRGQRARAQLPLHLGCRAGQTRLCWTNGRFSGYDSPELATLSSFTLHTARWRVQAGGRIGGVFGEDAIEGGCPVVR